MPFHSHYAPSARIDSRNYAIPLNGSLQEEKLTLFSEYRFIKFQQKIVLLRNVCKVEFLCRVDENAGETGGRGFSVQERSATKDFTRRTSVGSGKIAYKARMKRV